MITHRSATSSISSCIPTAFRCASPLLLSLSFSSNVVGWSSFFSAFRHFPSPSPRLPVASLISFSSLLLVAFPRPSHHQLSMPCRGNPCRGQVMTAACRSCPAAICSAIQTLSGPAVCPGSDSRRRDCHSAAPPLPFAGVSIVMERERQQNDSLVNG